MEKFIKSLFNTAERRRNSRIEENEEDKTLPPIDGRRKLSTSRSGRMKQANKKRHSLSLDVYNNNNQDIQMVEKPKSAEITTTQRPPAVTEHKQATEVPRSLSVEEEIDRAFEIINKSLVTDL